MRKKPSELIEQVLLASSSGDDCLQALAAEVALPDHLRKSFELATNRGLALVGELPGYADGLLNDWLGKRWYLLHRSRFVGLNTWNGVVGSRLDRTAEDFADWPHWIERVMRRLLRDRQTLLLVPETATAKLLTALARQTQVNCLHIRLPSLPRSRPPHSSVGKWLDRSITEAMSEESVAYATLWVSPGFGLASGPFEHLPLRDRTVFALAKRLVALASRPGGNISQLLQLRLEDERFPTGSVSIRMSAGRAVSNVQWLQQRAVGWYLPARDRAVNAKHSLHWLPHRCSGTERSSSEKMAHPLPAVSQWTAPVRLWHRGAEYLSHCVRGDDGHAFRQGSSEAVLDAMLRNEWTTSPFETLLRIVSSGRLRASSKLLRTGTSAVSFTAIPLTELMLLRQYQPHLARWDWEPYGVMILRTALEALGARPVLYGDDRVYQSLRIEDRPYFQPAQRKSPGRTRDHWQSEQEWRLMDDVRLHELPRGSLMLFVATAAQAQSLAAHSPWPVIWQQPTQTRSLPTAAKSLRRGSSQTSRN